MKCLACDVILTDKEANRKYDDVSHIHNPEHHYIGLCNKCLAASEVNVYQEEEIEVDEYEEDLG